MKILENDPLGARSIDTVKLSDGKEWAMRMYENGFSYKTISNYKRSLKASFHMALEDDCVRKNPFHFQLSEVIEDDSKPKVALSEEQEAKLLDFMEQDRTYQKYHDDVLILLKTGLRISELCGLTRSDIDFKNHAIRINHQLLKDKDLWDCIDFVEPALGVAGEPIYPPTWTQSVKVPKFWCYGENAKADFRAEMQKKYKTLDAANSTWSSDFASWDDVTVLAPGELKGLYWYDVLTWYRDSKREKVLWMLDYTRSVLAGTGKRLVINVPGVQYTIDQWNEALNSSTGGAPNLMTMEDSDYLLDYACDTGEMIEYTGLTPGIENVEEIARIQKYIKDKGYEVDVWAENVGDEGTASRIDDLKDLVIGNRLYGFDYTHSIYLFESDKVTVRQERVDALTDLYAAVDELYNANK